MKIIEVARQQQDLLNEGIAYIAVWQEAQKNGKRSWFTEDIFPADTSGQTPIFDEEQKARLAEIATLDADAVLLNGYYHAWIGSAEEPLNAASIAVGIEKHYQMHNSLVIGYLVDEEQPPSFEDLGMDGREELGLGKTQREDTQGENGMSASDVPETITIALPATNVNEDILRALIQSKATLIKAALGRDGTGDLPIEFVDGKVQFEWLRFGVDSGTVMAWSTFLAAAVKFSKTAKRVTARDAAVTNERFSFRTFMVKIGMNDADNKWARKRLLQNLTGDSAFATPESKQRWLEKHGSTKNAEVDGNEAAE